MRKRILAAAASVLLLALLPAAPIGAAEPDLNLPDVGFDLPEGASVDDLIALEGGGYALELEAPVPEWYTPELHDRVIAAGREGVPVPAEASREYSSLAFMGIRPGAWILSPGGCTTNFVFGSPGNYTIGTAGHCGSVGDEVTLVALPGVLMNIGRISKSIDQGIGADFAEIDIYPEMQDLVNPSMSYFGGPSGTAQPAIGDVVVHSGHGLVIGTGGTPRVGVVTYVGSGDQGGGGSGGGNDGGGNGNGGGNGGCKPSKNCKKRTALSRLAAGDTAFGWDGEAMLGDSGSAVRNVLGAASGNLTHLVVGTQYLPAFIAGTTAPYLEQLAGSSIATAPLIPDPLT